MRARQSSQLIESGFLKHEIELVGKLTVRHEHSVASGKCGIYPQAVTNNIGLRNLLQRLAVAQVNVTTGNQRMQRIRRFAHDLLIQRKLERKEVLR